MAEGSKVPVSKESGSQSRSMAGDWRPFESLRQEVDRLFEDFGRGFGWSPFHGSLFSMQPFGGTERAWRAPAVDVAETDSAYEIKAELPGMEQSDIEVKVADDVLTIQGEKKEEKEEKKKDYYLSERHYGSFQRSFRVPEGVDPGKIEATFKNGLLTVMLPKTPEAQKKQKKIEVKTG